MKQAMVDVEALRLNQPWVAPLMEVGVVIFDPQVGQIISEHCLWVKQSTLPRWATIEEDTADWWQSQPYWYKLAKHLQNDSQHCKQVIAEVCELVRGMPVWFAGPTYDQVMLEAYTDHYRMNRPWGHADTRDFRTIRKQFDEQYRVALETRTGLHCALDDARFQAQFLIGLAQDYHFQVV